MSESLPVLTIPVDNEQLKETLSLYEKLTAAAERYNSKYGSPLGGGGNSGGGGNGGNAGGDNGNGSDDRRGGGKGFLNNVNKLAKSLEKSFDQVNKTLDKTIGKLKGLFESAISWGLKIALLSTGSAFGYNLIAKNAAQQLMVAQGNRMTTGQMQAAKNVYGNRFGNVDGVIQGLNSASGDVSSPFRSGLISLGLNPVDDPGKNLPLFYQKIADLAAHDDGNGLAYSRIKAMRLDGMLDQQNYNQVAANRDILPGLNNKYEATSKSLQMSEATNRSYQSVNTTFDTTTDRMFNSFKTALATLNEPIEKLSKTFSDAVDSFLSGPNGKAVFETLKEGVETFSAWISNPGFQKDLGEFSKAVADIVKAIGNAVIWLGKLVAGDNTNGLDKKEFVSDLKRKSSFVDQGETGAKPDGSISGLFSAIGKTTWGLISTIGGSAASSIASKVSDPSAQMLNGYLTGEPVQHAQASRRKLAGNGLPSNLLNVVEQVESGGNRFAVSKAGAMGPFQFMPGTAKDMGLRGGEVFDREKAAAAAERYFKMLFKRYEGDAAKAVAAYNWGMGNVDKHGLTSLPKETYDYLRKILPQIGEADSLERIAMRSTQQSQAATQSRMVIDVALNQAPGSDINAQLRSNMPPPIIIPF